MKRTVSLSAALLVVGLATSVHAQVAAGPAKDSVKRVTAHGVSAGQSVKNGTPVKGGSGANDGSGSGNDNHPMDVGFTIDGTKADTENYQTLWINSTNPTQFGDNAPTSGGIPSDPKTVTTGLEFRVPLSLIGSPTGAIKMTALVTNSGYNSASNQIVGELPVHSPTMGDPALLNYNSAPYDTTQQYVTLTPITLGGTLPTIDGTRDAVYAPDYTPTTGNAWFQTQIYTTGTDSLTGTLGPCGGSEIDNIVLAKDATYLYIFIGGNLQSDFHKLSLFFDTVAGAGQNTLLQNNNNVDSNGLNRLGGLNGPSGAPGLTFDTGFEPDFWMDITGNGNVAGSGLFLNYAELPTAGAGAGGFQGTGKYGTLATPVSGTIAGAGAAAGWMMSVDNTNIHGVVQEALPNSDTSTGSEIDAVYGHLDVANKMLYLMVTGNLESTGIGQFNNLDVILDVASGGQNELDGNNPDIDFNSLNRMGYQTTTPEAGNNPFPRPRYVGAITNIGVPSVGLKFDTNFLAEYIVAANNGNNPVENYSNVTTLRAGGARRHLDTGGIIDYSTYDGGAKTAHNPINFPGTLIATTFDDGATTQLQSNFAPRQLSNDVAIPGLYDPNTQTNPPSGLPGLIQVSINNANTAGISDTIADATAAAAVKTGVEFAIDLREAGWDGVSPIKIAGWVSSNDRGTISNQVFGGLPSNYGNLGNPRSAPDGEFSSALGTYDPATVSPGVDFSTIPGGPHYLTINLPLSCKPNIAGNGCLLPTDLLGFLNLYFVNYDGHGSAVPATDTTLPQVNPTSPLYAVPCTPSAPGTFPVVPSAGLKADYDGDCQVGPTDLLGFLHDYFNPTASCSAGC